MDARTLHGYETGLIHRVITLVAVVYGVHTIPGVQHDAHAAVFEPSTPIELVEAFSVAGVNAEDDVIELRGQTFYLTSELVLEPDDGHSLDLLNGALERTEDVEPFRLLNILAVPEHVQGDGLPITIEGVDFSNGLYQHDDQLTNDDFAGGGGAILTHRETVISNARFDNNRVIGGGSGGAIKHSKLLEISDALFSNNHASANQNFDIAQGGAIATVAGASLIVGHTYFTDNSADWGGAIYATNQVFDLNITHSAFSGNQAQAKGGAIWSDIGEGGVLITNTSFIENQAPLGGGALYSHAKTADINLSHLTIWGNRSNPDTGAGIRAMSALQGSISLRNSVVGDNVGGNCGGVKDVSLSIKHSSYNLMDDNSCGSQGINLLTDSASVFSGALDYYGGSIPSMPIAESSPGRNMVPRENCLSFDSRDVPRLDNAFLPDQYCDAGAFEYVPQEYVDMDEDGVDNYKDNCVRMSNPLQSDIDEDGLGDQCDNRDDRDSDNDVVLNFHDNCPSMSNFLQIDNNRNGIGDACELRSVHLTLAPVLQ